MDTFDKEYTIANSPEDSFELFSPSQLEQSINNSIIDNYNSNDEQHSLPTEENIPESITIPQNLSPNISEVMSESSAENAGLISQNNNRNNGIANHIEESDENRATNEQTNKSKGRRKKGSTLEDGHTGDYPGNLLRKDGTTFMDSMYTCLNKRCKIYDPKLKLKNIDFAKQFGFNKDNERFIKQKLYKILRYGNDNNQMVIEMMTNIHKDRIFMYIINSTFEYLFGKYIAEKNTIYFGEGDTNKNCFETLSEMAIRRENKNRRINSHWTEEKLKRETTLLIESSKNFLIEVNGEGKFRKRKRRTDIIVLCNYEVVEKIENFLENQKPYIY